MSKTVYVLDASALLALLFDEAGAEVVEPNVHGASISAANWSEVVAKLVDKGLAPSEVLADLDELDVTVVPVSRKHAERAGTLRVATRSAGLSLGDRLSLALAQDLKATVLTSDRAWRQIKVSDVIITQIR